MAWVKMNQKTGSWYCHWYEPGSSARGERRKSHGKGPVGKQLAERHKKQIEAAIHLGLYRSRPKLNKWKDFKTEYIEKVVAPKPLEQAEMIIYILNRFEEICRPHYMEHINSKMIESYIAIRRMDKGINSRYLSPATVNKDLRYLEAMLNVAHDWEVIEKVPKIKPLREPERVKTYVNEEEFRAIYQACPDDWWRSFLLFLFMTGWRVKQARKLRWYSVDLEHGEILGDAYDAKGRRDVLLPLHDVLLDAFRLLRENRTERSDFVFPIRGKVDIYHQFFKIQKQAGIKPRNKRPGRWYTFHDLRRGFATLNADRLDLFELQKLMQHKSLETTRRYVNMAHRLRPAVEKLHTPKLD